MFERSVLFWVDDGRYPVHASIGDFVSFRTIVTTQKFLELYQPDCVRTSKEIDGTYNTSAQYSAKVLLQRYMKENVDRLACHNKKLNVQERIACNYLSARVTRDANEIEQLKDLGSTRPVFNRNIRVTCYISLHCGSSRGASSYFMFFVLGLLAQRYEEVIICSGFKRNLNHAL